MYVRRILTDHPDISNSYLEHWTDVVLACVSEPNIGGNMNSN
jgi:hypothetical protein